MKSIPNKDYRFNNLMHRVITLCVKSVGPKTIAFVCLPGDEHEIHSRVKSFTMGKDYGIVHYVSAMRRDPAILFENGAQISILAYENDWIGKMFTDMYLFCHPEEIDSEIKICMASCVYSVPTPRITVLTDARPEVLEGPAGLRRLR